MLALNAWILARLFKTEYTPWMSSIEGSYIGLSRWIETHCATVAAVGHNAQAVGRDGMGPAQLVRTAPLAAFRMTETPHTLQNSA